MKLLTKISINFFILSMTVFLLSGITAYYFLRVEVDEKVDYKLFDEKQDFIQRYSEGTSEIPLIDNSISVHFNIKKIPLTFNSIEVIKDTLIHAQSRFNKHHSPHNKKLHLQPYRQLTFSHTIANQSYLITLRRDLVEARDLKQAIQETLLIFFLFLLFGLLAMNYYLSKKTWVPFYNTVKEISNFNLSIGTSLELASSDIKEFNTLNQVINNMSKKVARDYSNLKEFSENASHEMQTPLSIIRSEVESIIQDESLNSAQLKGLQSINQATIKLSRLNQSLLLLTKIENEQFSDWQEINLQHLIDENLNAFLAMAEIKQVYFKKEYLDEPRIKMHSHLAGILIGNILKNAVRYCDKNSEIKIRVTASSFSISNKGPNPHLPTEQLFYRFKKANPSSDSLGLGLAIVKKICDMHKMDVSYKYKDNMHTLCVNLKA